MDEQNILLNVFFPGDGTTHRNKRWQEVGLGKFFTYVYAPCGACENCKEKKKCVVGMVEG